MQRRGRERNQRARELRGVERRDAEKDRRLRDETEEVHQKGGGRREG